MKRLLLIAVAAASLAGPAGAVNPDEQMADPAMEARAHKLSRDLRCVVCQNQSIDDSDADLARDLRVIVRERLVAGDSDAEVRAYLVARYGDFVRYRPPVKPITWLLWGGPFLLLFIGIALLVNFLRQRTRTVTSAELSAEEQRRAQQLIDGLSSSPKSDPKP